MDGRNSDTEKLKHLEENLREKQSIQVSDNIAIWVKKKPHTPKNRRIWVLYDISQLLKLCAMVPSSENVYNNSTYLLELLEEY